MSGKTYKPILIFAVIYLALVGCSKEIEKNSASQSLLTDPVYTLDSVIELGFIDTDIDTQIQRAVEEGHMPSLSVGVIVDDELVWAKSYGKTPAGIETAYHTGSVSKTFTATAILQLYENGLLNLDTDINLYLPFKIRHHDHPDSPITLRMLLSHTSGLIRGTEDYSRFQLRDHAIQDTVYRNFELDLKELSHDKLYGRGEFFEAYLVPGGKFYSEEIWTENFGS